MKTKLLAGCIAAGCLAAPAQALEIDLFDLGGMASGTAQYQAFRTAADYWEQIVSTDTTLRVDIGYNAMSASGPIASTNNYFWVGNVGTVIDAIQASGSGSAIDAIVAAHLPDASSGSIGMWTPGYTSAPDIGADPSTKIFDNDGSYNNSAYGVSWAQGKALGLVYVDGSKDGSITFNSDLNFDFDPTDGIGGSSYDFVFTAFHELGHIMGFTSGVDYYDTFSPSYGYNWNYDWIGHGMDLFRYSDDGLDWSLGGSPFFSIDGGATALLDGQFSTGSFNGNGFQASHWLEGGGIMDPTANFGEMGVLTAVDLAAFDALGWTLSVDPLANPNLRITTAAMAGAVPEPASWALMIAGFGLIGTAMRRRERGLAAIFAG